jgi:hypothetical protein
LDLEDPRFLVFAVSVAFFEAGLLTRTLRAGRVLRAAGFFAELFFFVGFDIA